MDLLHFDSIPFPIHSGALWCAQTSALDYAWGIEIHCGESPALDFHTWRDDRVEQPLDWLAGTEPSLYAQMLPLRVDSPEALVGRAYTFPQSPDDATPDWPTGIGWPFFCLYLHEHHCAYPMQVAFTERRERLYRVELAGSYKNGGLVHELRAATWLTAASTLQ